jgi:hypothetical protein
LDVVASHWWSETCACGTDDNRLVVQFKHQQTRLEWVVSDQQEYRRVRAHIVCRGGRFGARLIDGRAIFYRPTTDMAWMCIPIPAGARWYPSTGKPLIAPRGKLTISVRQVAGRTGRLRPAALQRMLASARRPSVPGRTSPSRFELPPQNEIKRMRAAFRQALLLPTRLPGGFIYSDWNLAGPAHKRDLRLTFGRNSLFTQITWHVSSSPRGHCPTSGNPPRRAVVNGRSIYVNEGIHGVEVSTCIAPGIVGNRRPAQFAMWYDIRLHNPTMLRLAMRMIATAKPIR